MDINLRLYVRVLIKNINLILHSAPIAQPEKVAWIVKYVLIYKTYLYNDVIFQWHQLYIKKKKKT